MYLDPQKKQDFYSCAMRRFEPGEHHVSRVFRYSVLILMFSGTLRFREDGEDIELKPGEYYIQRAGLSQQGVFPSDAPEYFYIHFEGGYTEDAAGIPLRGCFSPKAVMKHSYQLEKVYRLQSLNPFPAQGLFYQILGCLGEKEQAGNLARSVAEYVAGHFSEQDFSMEQIVEAFPYTRDYLIKLFKKQFLVTPHRYITNLRIEYAKQLLLTTERTLTEISDACGYGDYSVFYKNFVRDTGMSPRSWLETMMK